LFEKKNMFEIQHSKKIEVHIMVQL
jgi:hypothetical protein